MKNTQRTALIALVAVIGFSIIALSVIGCELSGHGSGSSPDSVTYKGTAGSKTYTLKIEGGARAVLTPAKNDKYTLTAGGKTSTGIVFSFTGGILTLTPSIEGALEFTVTVSGNGITAMTGTITYDNGNTETAPSTFTPGGGGGNVSGSYSYSESGVFSATITFNEDGTFTMTGTLMGGQINDSGTYTVAGNTITCTYTVASDPKDIGKKETYTIIDANTIKDDDHGDLWKKKSLQALF